MSRSPIEVSGPRRAPAPTIYRGWPKVFTIRVWLDAQGPDALREAEEAKLGLGQQGTIKPTFVVVGHEDREIVLMPSNGVMNLAIKGPAGSISRHNAVVEGGIPFGNGVRRPGVRPLCSSAASA
jgi:hypothetical protein